jgi:hypothetical protein
LTFKIASGVASLISDTGEILNREKVSNFNEYQTFREILNDFIHYGFVRYLEMTIPKLDLPFENLETDKSEGMKWQWKSWTFKAVGCHYKFREFQIDVQGGDDEFGISTCRRYDCLPTVKELRALLEQVEGDILLRSKFIIFLESRGIIWRKRPEYHDGEVEVSPVVVDFHKGTVEVRIPNPTIDYQGIRKATAAIQAFLSQEKAAKIKSARRPQAPMESEVELR